MRGGTSATKTSRPASLFVNYRGSPRLTAEGGVGRLAAFAHAIRRPADGTRRRGKPYLRLCERQKEGAGCDDLPSCW